MGNHRAPELGRFIVAQPNIATGNRTTREATEHDGLRIASELLADLRNRRATVLCRRVGIAPPVQRVSVGLRIDERQAEPNVALAAADAVA